MKDGGPVFPVNYIGFGLFLSVTEKLPDSSGGVVTIAERGREQH